MTPPTSDRFVALLRGINVGGRNAVGMGDLSACFSDTGYRDVRTHGQSGNVLFRASADDGLELESSIEGALQTRFSFPILVIVRSRDELAATVAAAPADHGSTLLRSEVLFVKSPLTAEDVYVDLPPLRQDVDAVAVGPGALYFSRVAARARQTRITALMAMPVFQRMTIRSWRTTTRLLELLDVD